LAKSKRILKLPQIEINKDEDLDILVSNIQKEIQTALRHASPVKNVQSKFKTPYWNNYLERVRRQTRAARESYQSSQDAITRGRRLITYREL